MQTSPEPPPGEPTEDRRQGDRRAAGRRAEDHAHRRSHQVQAAIWAIVGSVVVLYLFLVGLNTFSPGEAPAATVIVLILAVLWLAHAWRRLLAGGSISPLDRERRGF